MKPNSKWLMTMEEGENWNAYKATLGPLYPGYPNFDKYMNWLKNKFTEYGCIDILEHHWNHESYRVNDWPDHNSGALGLTVNGRIVPVGTFLMLSGTTEEKGLTAPLAFYDSALGEPQPKSFSGKIVVMETLPHPQKPFDYNYLNSYVITDTNYRSGPEPPADILEIPDPTISNSWNTRWDFGQWGTLQKYAEIGDASALIVASNLTFGCLEGLYDRQRRHAMPCIVIDREAKKEVIVDARNGKSATVTLLSQYFDCDAWNFICFLPGKNYGIDNDEYITINVHTDAMPLTQDNGSLGALGIARYFSNVPQEQRNKTLLFCIDSRHFIEGFEFGNWEHDPYQVYPHLIKKVTATVGLEHMGEMEAAEDYEHNRMIPTGRPEYTFMKANDNDYCEKILIEAAIDSGLERADIKIDGRPDIHGMFKGLVRAVQASCHKLNVCEIGQAGNWPGAHTQTFSTMQYFGPKKFRDEVHTWTQVVGNMMETDSRVYNICWSKLNTAIRKLAADSIIDELIQQSLLSKISAIFSEVEAGEYEKAICHLSTDLKNTFDSVIPQPKSTDVITALNDTLKCLSSK